MKYFLLILMSITGSFLLHSQDRKLRFEGFLDSYHACGVERNGSILSSRTRFRPELLYLSDNTKLFVSTNLFHNYVVPQLTEIFLREAYLYYTKDKFSVWMGRQIMTFGQSDGLPISDYLSPLDLVEFLARDYDDIRMGADGVRLRYTGKNSTTELYFIPVPQFNRLPIPGTPWGVSVIPGMGASDYINRLPEKKIDHADMGIRKSFYLKGFDLSAMYLHTWDKMPLFDFVIPSDGVSKPYIDILYHRLNLASLDFAKPMGKFVWKGEGAFYFDKTYQTTDSTKFKKAQTINGMMGLDFMPGNNWTIAMQIQNESILSDGNFVQNRNNLMGTFMINKNLFRNTFLVGSQGMFRISESAAFNRFSLDYALNNEIRISMGYDLFFADKPGLFKQYQNNDEIWAKFKYSF